MSTTTQLMTAEELLRLPESPLRHELVKGELITMTLPGEEHGAIVMNIAAPLGYHVKVNNLGIVYGAETGFKIERNPDTVLGPGVAFVTKDRIEKIGITKGYRFGAPDLVVEVNSPGDSRRNVDQKVQRWLNAGAALIWVVDPKSKAVIVYDGDNPPSVLREPDELTGGSVVPGFRISVASIFI